MKEFKRILALRNLLYKEDKYIKGFRIFFIIATIFFTVSFIILTAIESKAFIVGALVLEIYSIVNIEYSGMMNMSNQKQAMKEGDMLFFPKVAAQFPVRKTDFIKLSALMWGVNMIFPIFVFMGSLFFVTDYSEVTAIFLINLIVLIGSSLMLLAGFINKNNVPKFIIWLMVLLLPMMFIFPELSEKGYLAGFGNLPVLIIVVALNLLFVAGFILYMFKNADNRRFVLN